MKVQSRLRAALLQGTMLFSPALALAALASPALAQSIPANTQPQGGLVVGGTASIAQGTSATTITQSSNRAVIDWRSFSVGRDQLVQFQQPSSSAMALNRVTGPDPSVIAGRVTANGGIVLVNQSGVFFAGGSQVSAHSVIASTADITNAAFMGGGAMSFDRAGKPGAKIENNGTITVKQTGLAALVAPQVVNNGVIRAQLATVVLAGAERHVIDINGDGLVSFDITDAVRTPPAGNAALVTNTGSISARGGTVLLTASAADGIVQNLVRAGGTITANTDATTGRKGQILFSGTGGSIVLEGVVQATGAAASAAGPAMAGGSIRAVADRVLVTGTARLNASGAAGGGSIAVGIATIGGKTVIADRTGIAEGAVLEADATVRGNGGRIDVNAKNAMVQAGTILARGGPSGGDGGTVDISSSGGLRLTGVVDVGAVAGALGTVILDPTTLTVVATGDPSVNVNLTGDLLFADPPVNAVVANGAINAITGNLVLQATNTITISAAIDKPTGNLTLQSGGTLTINAALVLGTGDLFLTSPVLAVNALVQVSAANTVTLNNGFGEGAGGTVTEAGAGRISGGALTQAGSDFDSIILNGLNTVNRIDVLTAINTLSFTNNAPLLLDGTFSGGTATVNVLAGDLTISGQVFANDTPGAATLRAQGNINLTATGLVEATGIEMSAGFNFAAGTADPGAAGGMTLAGSVFGAPFETEAGVTNATIQLNAGTGGIVQTGGVVQGGTLMVQSGGGATLDSVTAIAAESNEFDVLGPSRVTGNFLLSSYQFAANEETDLQIAGDVSVSGTLSLRSMDNSITEAAGARILAGGLALAAPDAITLGGDNQVASLGAVTAPGMTFRNVVDLTVAGPVNSTGDVNIAVAGGNATVSGQLVITDGDLLLTASGNVAVTPSGTISVSGVEFGGLAFISAAMPDSGFDATLPGAMTLAGSIGAVQLFLGAGTGGITQTSGQIQSGQLSIQSGGVALLNGASPATPNAIATALLNVTTSGNFALDNGTTPLVVAGRVTAANITLATTAEIDLSQSCAGVEVCILTPATLNAGTGRVSLQAGDLALLNPANSITGGLVEIAPRTVSDMLVGGAAGSTVAGALSVNQDALTRITATTLRLGATTPGGTTANNLAFAGAVAFANTLDLHSLANVTQASAASLTLGTLTGAAGGAIVLTDAANTATTIGDLSAAGNINLTLANAMSLAGLLSAPGQTITLLAGTGIAETGAGSIAGGTLNAQTAAGPIILAGANQVNALGAVTTPAGFAFNDTVALLTISPGTTVSAGGDIAISQTGSLAITGQLAAPGQTISLAAGTGISGTGALTSATLTAQTMEGSISLTGANAVDALGAVSTPGQFIFNDTVALLTIPDASTVSAGGGVAITETGALDIAGLVSAPGQTASLAAGTGISGNGAIIAGTFTAETASGDIVLGGPNQVDNLGSSSSPGNLTFNNDGARLTVPSGNLVQAGGVADITGAGDVVVDGTVRGATLTLRAAGLVAVNGFSAIALAGALHLMASTVTVTGLIAAGTDIVIDATTASLGGQATGNSLTVNASDITFNALNAAGTRVFLGLGTAGFASGSLDVAGLVVEGGRGVTLLGTIAGTGGQAAAALGVRADAAGAVFSAPPPQPNGFTLNGCPIAVSVCNPLVLAPVTVASNPIVILQDLDPRRYAVELTDTLLLLPRPRTVNLLAQPSRDIEEDLDLAPPNVRPENY